MADFFTFNWISLYIFVVVLLVLVLAFRKKLELQKMLFPVFYAGLFRTGFGLKFIEKTVKKHGEWYKFLGYCGIGVGFVGMIVIVWGVIQSLVLLISQPQAQAGVALVLPQTTIPGLGFLPFWYWILALFILILIHEFAHGVVAKAHGIPVQSSGLGFFAIILPIIPLAFVEPNEKKMEKQSDVVQYSVFAAGPFSNILTAVIILLLFMWVFTPITNAITEPDGIGFTKINESYPAWELPDTFVIREVNGVDTVDVASFVQEMDGIVAGEEITLGNGTNTFTIPTVENPDTGNAFIGITNIQNMKIPTINDVVFNVYAWIVGLFKWVAWLSFLIGLANLLPLGPVDGGRMLKTLLERVQSNKARAHKQWVFISLLVLFLIIASLVYPLF